MSRLIIDITELSGWQGKLTGVPRVMSELGSRFAAENNKTIFVAWRGKEMGFRKVDFPLETQEPEPQFDKRRGLLTKAKKLKNSSKVAGLALALPERAARHLLKPQTVLSEPEVKPHSGDVLFVMADWHGSDPSLIERLINLKEEGVKLVQISYDMLPIVMPQYSGHATTTFRKYVHEVYPLCDTIIAISQHTKEDATIYLGNNNLRVPPIEVMRLGDDFTHAAPSKPTEEAFLERIADKEQYILCVSTIEARKNHTLLYYAYKLAVQRKQALPKLVIVGRLGWLAQDVYEIITNDPDTREQLIFLQSASDNELSWLYENCLFSIYPSFYEGWGLPVAESLARGIPCVCSNSSSIPEVGGKLLSYFSPVSTDECLAEMVRLLDPAELNKARKKAASYKAATWDDCFVSVKHIIGGV